MVSSQQQESNEDKRSCPLSHIRTKISSWTMGPLKRLRVSLTKQIDFHSYRAVRNVCYIQDKEIKDATFHLEIAIKCILL